MYVLFSGVAWGDPQTTRSVHHKVIARGHDRQEQKNKNKLSNLPANLRTHLRTNRPTNHRTNQPVGFQWSTASGKTSIYGVIFVAFATSPRFLEVHFVCIITCKRTIVPYHGEAGDLSGLLDGSTPQPGAAPERPERSLVHVYRPGFFSSAPPAPAPR